MIFFFFIFFFIFSSLLFSFLRYSFLLSSFLLSSVFSLLFSLSVFFLCLCLRVLVVCVSSCVFVWCGVVWCGVCRVVWHAENPVCRLETLSVCRFKVPVYAGNTRTCFSACGRGAGTHGDVLNRDTESVLSLHTAVIANSAYQETAHVRLSLGPTGSPKETLGSYPFSSLRKDREQHVPDSSNHSLYPIKLSSSSYPGETLEGTSREMVRFVFRSHEKSITNDLRVSIS